MGWGWVRSWVIVSVYAVGKDTDHEYDCTYTGEYSYHFIIHAPSMLVSFPDREEGDDDYNNDDKSDNYVHMFTHSF